MVIDSAATQLIQPFYCHQRNVRMGAAMAKDYTFAVQLLLLFVVFMFSVKCLSVVVVLLLFSVVLSVHVVGEQCSVN